MVTLYISSVERHAGKELMTLGLIDRFRRDGLNVGYFKPMGHSPIRMDHAVVDRGAWLIAKVFNLEDPMEWICPVVITQDLIIQNFEKEVTGLKEKIESAFEKISAGKDIVVVGCDRNFSDGGSFGLAGLQLISILKAYAIFIERYTCNFCIDFLLELKKFLGDSMIGVVFNRVDATDVREIDELVFPFLNRKQMDLYGRFPRDTFLASLRIEDLVKHLGADVVCGKDNLEGYVEDFLVGGMQVDTFITYLLKKPSAGVIVGGDRTDIQLVAIENEVRCLILSGNLYPNDTIIARAQARGVPILVARDDTYTVAKKMEAIVGELNLKEKKKIEHGMALVARHFEFGRLYTRINLKAPASLKP